jgi:hypothetical protein
MNISSLMITVGWPAYTLKIVPRLMPLIARRGGLGCRPYEGPFFWMNLMITVSWPKHLSYANDL